MKIKSPSAIYMWLCNTHAYQRIKEKAYDSLMDWVWKSAFASILAVLAAR